MEVGTGVKVEGLELLRQSADSEGDGGENRETPEENGIVGGCSFGRGEMGKKKRRDRRRDPSFAR